MFWWLINPQTNGCSAKLANLVFHGKYGLSKLTVGRAQNMIIGHWCPHFVQCSLISSWQSSFSRTKGADVSAFLGLICVLLCFFFLLYTFKRYSFALSLFSLITQIPWSLIKKTCVCNYISAATTDIEVPWLRITGSQCLSLNAGAPSQPTTPSSCAQNSLMRRLFNAFIMAETGTMHWSLMPHRPHLSSLTNHQRWMLCERLAPLGLGNI